MISHFLIIAYLYHRERYDMPSPTAMLLFWFVWSQTLTFMEEIGLSANASKLAHTRAHACTPHAPGTAKRSYSVPHHVTTYNMWYKNKWPTGGDGRVSQFTVRGFLNSNHSLIKVTEMLLQTHTCSFLGSLSTCH